MVECGNKCLITNACSRTRQSRAADAGVMRRENSKYRRKLERLPDGVKEILDGLTAGEYYLESYNPQYLGWKLEITINKISFILVSEWNQVYILKIIEGKEIQIYPVDTNNEESSPDIIARAINAQVA
jgi:hypothetical protein